MAGPKDYDLEHLRVWLKHAEGGDGALSGPDAKVYGTPGSRAFDLAVIQARPDAGPFMNWALGGFTTFVHRRIVERFKRLKLKEPSPVYEQFAYEGSLFRCAQMVSASIPSLLLCMTIAILYSVSSTSKRVGLVACFCVLYSICLGVFTRAQGSESFSSVST